MVRKPIRRRTPARIRWPEVTSEAAVAAVAVMLSLITLTTSAWFVLRGSVVTAVPPENIFFYRDASNDPSLTAIENAVLTAGVDTALVNTASANYGDVVTRITMQIDAPGDHDAVFRYQTLVTPVFSETAARQAANCPVTSRCVLNGNFLAIEEPRRTLDVAGGSSRSEYIGFVLNSSNCAPSGHCDAYRNFTSASQALDRAERLVIRFHYRLHSDGEKTATCIVDLRPKGAATYRPWLAGQLKNRGWAILPCQPGPLD